MRDERSLGRVGIGVGEQELGRLVKVLAGSLVQFVDEAVVVCRVVDKPVLQVADKQLIHTVLPSEQPVGKVIPLRMVVHIELGAAISPG